MATLKKVTKSNHLPTKEDGRFPVYSAQFNELIDDLNQGTGDLSVEDLAVTGDLTVTGATTLNGTLTLGDAAADALTVNATTTYAEPINYDNATGITAFATGGQASATALTAEINNVTTVATAGDSVKLPAAVAGKHVYVKNSGATALDIFPASSDSIDALAADLAIRIQPGSSINFYAKDATVWESSIDNSITLNSPTTVTGQLEIKATASAGNTVTTITNASQAAARTYTIPDAGASADFIMSQGAQSKTGQMTFATGITVDTITERSAGVGVTADSVLLKDSTVALGDGTVGDLSVKIGADANNGLYGVSDTQLGIAIEGALVATADTLGLTADSLRARVELGTANTGVTAVSYGDGRNFTTVLTVSQADAVTVADAAALADGYLLYTFPAGAIVVNSAYMSMAVTLAEDTTATADVGLGTLLASDAQATLDADDAACENIITGQTAADCNGTATVKTIANAPLVIEAASDHTVYFNIADTWADTAGADLTGDIAGTVTLNWTLMA